MSKLSLAGRVRSIRYAVEGILQFFKEEHNARIHLVATGAVIGVAYQLGVSETEAILLLLVTGLVWAAEIMNTAIERTVDLVSINKDPRIKFIKDVAAAAVLVMAIVALITGFIIFIPKL